MIALVVALLLAPPPIVLDETLGFTLAIGPTWNPVTPATVDGGTVLGRWQNGGDTLVVARSRGNTDGAYAKERKARDAYLEGLETGVKGETPGYRRLGASERTLGAKKTPAYDLWFRGDAGVRGMRFVFFRGYMVVLALSSPRRKQTEEHRRLIDSFVPVDPRTEVTK